MSALIFNGMWKLCKPNIPKKDKCLRAGLPQLNRNLGMEYPLEIPKTWPQ